MRRVLVLDRRGAFATAVRRASTGLDAEVVDLSRTVEAASVAARVRPDVVVAGPSELSAAGLRRLQAVHRADPRTVIVLSPNGRPVSIAEAARCGASELLPYPSGVRRMRSTIERALALAASLRDGSAPGPSEPKLAHVWTVTSASGGCGKTFYATNFAGYLAKAGGGRVLLVDLDLQFGEVSVSLRISPEHTIADVLDGASLPELTVAHKAGYDVLCAPTDPVLADRIGPREATAVLEEARRTYDHVVVDTPPALNEVVLAAFDLSGSLVVMATMDVPSLKNLNVFLRTLDRLKVPSDGVSLVLNKAEDGTGIDVRQVERLYPQGFTSVLPYAKEVARSINAGMPVVFAEPGCDVSRRFVAGARKLAPAEQPLPWDTREGVRLPWWKRLVKRGARS